MSGWRRSAFTNATRGQSPVGQRHFDAPRFVSEPANVHVPCLHDGGSFFAPSPPNVARLACLVDGMRVVALVKRRSFGHKSARRDRIGQAGHERNLSILRGEEPPTPTA